MTSGFNLKNEKDVKEYLKNIDIEYRFSCYSENNPDGCNQLGKFLEVHKKDIAQAKKVFKVNCDTNNWGESCYRYASILSKERKPELLDEEIKYFERGCVTQPRSCFNAGLRMGYKADTDSNVNDVELYTKALEYLDKACEQKEGSACFNLTSIYYNGIPKIGLKRNPQKIFEYLLKGCESGHLQSCINVSFMYYKGDGVEKNEDLATVYRKKAKKIQEDSVRNLPIFTGQGIN